MRATLSTPAPASKSLPKNRAIPPHGPHPIGRPGAGLDVREQRLTMYGPSEEPTCPESRLSGARRREGSLTCAFASATCRRRAGRAHVDRPPRSLCGSDRVELVSSTASADALHAGNRLSGDAAPARAAEALEECQASPRSGSRRVAHPPSVAAQSTGTSVASASREAVAGTSPPGSVPVLDDVSYVSYRLQITRSRRGQTAPSATSTTPRSGLQIITAMRRSPGSSNGVGYRPLSRAKVVVLGPLVGRSDGRARTTSRAPDPVEGRTCWVGGWP